MMEAAEVRWVSRKKSFLLFFTLSLQGSMRFKNEEDIKEVEEGTALGEKFADVFNGKWLRIALMPQFRVVAVTFLL